MSKYHSTITRRDFMKALGLGAGAVSAAGVAIPVFKDLDDMITSTPQKQLPWWVKQRDYDDITTEVEWSAFKAQNTVAPSLEMANNIVPDNYDNRTLARAQRDKLWEKGSPGFSHRDRAMSNIYTGTTLPGWTPGQVAPATSVVQGKKWNISPEDNFATIQAALHWIGIDSVGSFALNDKTKRLWDSRTRFEANDGEGINSNHPVNARWCIVFNGRQNYDQKRYELINRENDKHKSGFPTDLGKEATYQAYVQMQIAEFQFVRFMNSLGWYTGAGGQGNCVPYGIFGGTGEQARATYLMTPSYGLMSRRTAPLLTDMPIMPCKPIDFGGTKFCETCRRCAERCPSGAMGDENYKKRDWAIPASGGRPGYKGWRLDWALCKSTGAPNECGSCHGLCPFNHQSEALVHPIVRMTAATTPLFNSFFGFGDRLMNYAKPQTDKTLEAWWYRDLKSYAGDTIINAGRHKWNF